MDELLKAALDNDYITFNEKFKDILQTKYEEGTADIKENFKKNALAEMQINDGTKTIKCMNCGKTFLPGMPVLVGPCPKCGFVNP